ncbi:unnamed protein product [Mytilus coruscus]|uniref:Uncharacterized protein n=1 Tax=Mytilus coruscus TaxID=42192 RepID=A0A6J8EYI4_MYTCO|nr:unnamed protein product [Mytilus coruscus]
MPTLPFPMFPRVLEREIRAATFAFSRPLNTTEKKFAQEGFRKKPDGSIECVSCGIETQVNLQIKWTIYEVARLHKPSCGVHQEKLDYICRRSILINAQRPRGTYTFSNEVIKESLSKGFTGDSIMKAAIRFFVLFGAYPETGDMVEYIMC